MKQVLPHQIYINRAEGNFYIGKNRALISN